jgi:arylsulfatase A-like enzyme
MLLYRLLHIKIIFPRIIFLFLLLIISNSFQPKRDIQQPNIILIVADDLGYSDLASYGNRFIQTPNIDGLANEGIRFTQAYVTSPICGPSREGILTGRYQQRFGAEFMPYDEYDPSVMNNLRHNYSALKKTNPGLQNLKPDLLVDRKNFNNGIPENEITIAELLKQKGYATGLVGKWNIGRGQGFFPEHAGYDYCYYFEGGLTRYVDDPVDTSRYINQHLLWSFSEIPAWAPRYGSTAIREGRNEVKDTGYLTFSFAHKAIDFIDRHKNEPFFLTLTFNAPHDPFQVPKDYFNRISNVQDSVKRVYYGMIEALDDAVGLVEQKLKTAGLDKNTVIFFISDNGGATYTRATDNAPLRGGKCTHFDGGLMVPFFIKYPGAFTTNNVYDNPVSSLDIFSTIAAITHAGLPAVRIYDGVDLMPFLQHHTDSLPHNIFYWRNGYSKAIRKGNWKLYVNTKSKKTFLFDLTNDIGELHDLSAQQPEKSKELLHDLEHWEKTQTIKPSWKSGADVRINVNGEWFYFPT